MEQHSAAWETLPAPGHSALQSETTSPLPANLHFASQPDQVWLSPAIHILVPLLPTPELNSSW